MHVLIVENDPALANRLRRRLWREGHVVAVASTGAIGLTRAMSDSHDAVILDVRLPDIDGVEMTRRLRATGAVTPILMLATRAPLHDRLQGLDAGADDYLTTPFAFAELAARLRAITRRGETLTRKDRLVVGDLVLDWRTRMVRRGDRTLDLAPKEFALLEYLMRHPGQALTRAMLLEYVWDSGFDPRSNVVDAAIRRLRKAVDAGKTPPLIYAVRGVGYKIKDQDQG